MSAQRDPWPPRRAVPSSGPQRVVDATDEHVEDTGTRRCRGGGARGEPTDGCVAAPPAAVEVVEVQPVVGADDRSRGLARAHRRHGGAVSHVARRRGDRETVEHLPGFVGDERRGDRRPADAEVHTVGTHPRRVVGAVGRPVGDLQRTAVLLCLLQQDPVVVAERGCRRPVDRRDVADIGRAHRQPDHLGHALPRRLGHHGVDTGAEDRAGVVVTGHQHQGVAEQSLETAHRVEHVEWRVPFTAPAGRHDRAPAGLRVEREVEPGQRRVAPGPAHPRPDRVTDHADARHVRTRTAVDDGRVGRGRRGGDDDAAGEDGETARDEDHVPAPTARRSMAFAGDHPGEGIAGGPGATVTARSDPTGSRRPVRSSRRTQTSATAR